jgi:hypothetical protein
MDLGKSSASEVEEDKNMVETKNRDGEEFFNSLLAEGTDKSKGWHKSLILEEKEDCPVTCTIYTRPVEGSRVNMLRSDSVWKGIKMK